MGRNHLISLGILNGYVESPATEHRCKEFVWSFNKEGFWKEFFASLLNDSNEKKYEVTEVPCASIDNDLAVVLNPFGESYPEISLERSEVYETIIEFIKDGGVFVNTAGFPFFYSWIVSSGQQVPVSQNKVLIPKTIQVKDGAYTISELQGLVDFTGTRYYRDFGALTTFGGKIDVKPFQTEDDKKYFGELVSGRESITEFRALRSSVKGCVPVIRANRPDGEVYPISALEHGRGFMLVSAMGNNSIEEASLFAMATDRFLTWVASHHTR